MSRNKQITINLVTSILAFIINMGISFFLTPYITKNIGIEAYGFISLGSQFINYASLVSIALNSMAGRFITIEIHRENWEAANKYFNSVLLSNIIVAVALLTPSALVVAYLDKIVDVPVDLLTDVKLLFAFLFLNYLISIVVSSLGVSTFATNKLYLKSLREMESRVLKAVMLILLFVLLEPAVFYVGFTAVAVVLYVAFFNIYYTRKFLPKLKLNKAYFEIKAVFELISSGIWNVIIQVGQILLQGLDLLIANIFISVSAMGTLALSKTLPTLIITLVGVIASVFIPDFTILYSKEKTDELVKSIKRSMKILGIVINIPIAVLVVFGEDFYRLWVPNQDPKHLQILSIIAILILVISGPINSLYGVFTVTNKLKANAFVLLLTGFVNVIVVYTLLRVTNLGIYAIAGVSTVVGIIRNLVFTAPYGAKYLGLKWTTFYPEVVKSVIAFCFIIALGLVVDSIINVNSWISFFCVAVITGVLGLLLNSTIILKKQERIYLIKLIFGRIKNER